MKTKLAALAVVATAFALVGALSTSANAATKKPVLKTTTVTVSAFEMGFKLSKKVVPRGIVIFKVTNNGKVAHDFSFGSRGGGTPLLEPGATATLKVKFLKPRNYTYICTVEGHQEAGMIGVLKVK